MSGELREPFKLGDGSPVRRPADYFTRYERACVALFESRLRRSVPTTERQRELVRRFRAAYPKGAP